MIIRRAKEILNSSDTIDVVYQKNPVWIEYVNEDLETAYVRSLDNKNRMEVPILDLIEKEKH